MKNLSENDFCWCDNPIDKIPTTPTERGNKTFIFSQFLWHCKAQKFGAEHFKNPHSYSHKTLTSELFMKTACRNVCCYPIPFVVSELQLTNCVAKQKKFLDPKKIDELGNIWHAKSLSSSSFHKVLENKNGNQ